METGNYALLEGLVETVDGFAPNAGEGSESGTLLHIVVCIHHFSFVNRYYANCSIFLRLPEFDGINLGLKDLSGRTPLSYAAGKGHDDIVKLFLERKDIDPVSKDNTGRTPLDWARIEGHTEVTQLLAKYQIYGPDSWMLED